MVMFENHQSYDEAVSAKSAKLRSRDWMKTVSDVPESMASWIHFELLCIYQQRYLNFKAICSSNVLMSHGGIAMCLIMFQIEIAPYRV